MAGERCPYCMAASGAAEIRTLRAENARLRTELTRVEDHVDALARERDQANQWAASGFRAAVDRDEARAQLATVTKERDHWETVAGNVVAQVASLRAVLEESPNTVARLARLVYNVRRADADGTVDSWARDTKRDVCKGERNEAIRAVRDTLRAILTALRTRARLAVGGGEDEPPENYPGLANAVREGRFDDARAILCPPSGDASEKGGG